MGCTVVIVAVFVEVLMKAVGLIPAGYYVILSPDIEDTLLLRLAAFLLYFCCETLELYVGISINRNYIRGLFDEWMVEFDDGKELFRKNKKGEVFVWCF